MQNTDTQKPKGGAFPDGHPCATPGCNQPGDYRAPCRHPGTGSGDCPPAWQHFCLQHIREFNAQWNFFAGMDANEIWQAQSAFPHWEQATRSFARNAFAAGPDRVADTLGVLRWKTGHTARRPGLSATDRRALSRLGLDETATLADVKAAFRRLARRYHPDANAGSRSHENLFHLLSEAASHLQQSESFRRPDPSRRGAS